MNRRVFLQTAAAGAVFSSAYGVKEPRAATLPVISGPLWQYNPALSLGEWRRELDDMKRIGFDLFWLAHLQPSLSDAADRIGLRQILDLCAECGMQAILSIGSTPQWYGTLDLEAEVAAARLQVDAIRARCGDHPAFFGWYVPHEIYMAWDAFGAFINELYPALVALCKEADPDKPVTLSPFFILDQDKVFGDFRYASPQEYGDYWAGLVARAGFEIIMLQDSGEHFSFVTNDQRRPFFIAMQRACAEGGAQLWGNVESAEFECPSIEEYIRRYGRVHHGTVKDAPWRVVPIPRLAEKLELAAEYSERIVTWGYYEKGRPSLGPEAQAWYEAYSAYHDHAVSAGA